MKKIIMITLFLFIGFGCESLRCDCEYVVYDNNPTTNNRWEETYRSSWDASCFEVGFHHQITLFECKGF